MITRRTFLQAAGLATLSLATVGLSGCSGTAGGSTAKTYTIGDTVSTDILDFTLDRAAMSFYADKHLTRTMQKVVTTADKYALPTNESSDHNFVANKGRVLICLEFTVKNNDRSTINMCSAGNNWLTKDLTVTYGGKEYPVNGYDMNNPDGDTFGMKLGDAIFSKDDKATWEYDGSSNYLLRAEENTTFRVVGVAVFDPKSTADPFQLSVDVLNSEDKKEKFTYSIG